MATYSFNDVTVSLIGPGGAFQLGAGEGAAEGGVTVAQTNNKNTVVVGADGEGMHTLSADKSGTVTLRYMQTSPANALLAALYDAQTLDSRLHGKNLITITNSASGDVTTCRSCAFQKRPDLTYAKEGGTVEWVFAALKIDTVLGTY
ncbi:hypothetical protein CEG14_15580 [Bordetella genomosp. 1]|uniref:DUF3277 domain-containing protein n=1 Tax=Bordetella genomosp. 1 TaxID=1395607 RepID=A0A261SHF1_9BORD|nr:phage protein [Bordetella genomosp. 1]MDQ8033239.1 DUF3277 family protein [Bordetella sp.]OZI36417.1 hypothetical protein CEG14_15580 [Bordetella genomosp. 1]OZI57874.1 hypothetical protein CAL27_20970 [Bordetella genomosp. 1]